jgi:cytochrome c oxidase subunit 2
MNAYNVFDWWPVAASGRAHEIDHIVIAFTGVMILLVGPVFVLLPYWLWKYRHGRNVDRRHRQNRNTKLELTWIAIPFLTALVFFSWAGIVYNRDFHPPPDALIIHAVGKQWMWKFQHPGGQWEINNLHVPVDEPIRINLNSQDVVHALYIPALRAQMEVIPGRTTELWFKATRVGVYHLDCSEYCGVNHSDMRGRLYVMTASAYARWLRQVKKVNVTVASGPHANPSTEPAR